ncbi:serine protease [Myxococcus xanthus]|uniref:trypsin-like serine protease n=1 Tax=Myxococcus xanthus TaxID=34 RepID=UPI00112B4279|nr:trypsin-like serine protease [Myxococcus xanthus]QDE87955.1 serine protease [Myxococcus xanthus]
MRITRTASRRKLFGALLCTLSVAACGPAPEGEPSGEKSPEMGSQENPVVYGTDHRTDVYAYPASALRTRAEKSTVALMSPSDFNASNPNNVTFNGSTLQSAYNLCSTQRFLNDPTPAFCSGTLIDDDLVLTAGHCITSASACANTRFVFNFYRTSATALQTVTTADIFSCQSIVARQQSTVNGRNLDFAVVRLDRPATPRFEPAPIRPGNTALPLNTSVSVIGSGSGIPFKIDDGGWVRDARAGTLDYFVANTDTFGGNSGSGVYENNNVTVAGILVRGVTDYVSQGSCNVVNQCTDTGCGGESITYVRPAIDAYCAVAGSMRLCGTTEPPPPPPVKTFTFSATNTNSAQQNTTNVSVTLAAGQTLSFGTCTLPQATGTGDTYLRLYNTATNTQVAANDDACSRLSYVSFTAPSAGTYQMRAGCYSSGSCSGTVAYSIQ